MMMTNAGHRPARWRCRDDHDLAWWRLRDGAQLGICRRCGAQASRSPRESALLEQHQAMMRAGRSVGEAYAQIGASLTPFVEGMTRAYAQLGAQQTAILEAAEAPLDEEGGYGYLVAAGVTVAILIILFGLAALGVVW